MHRNTRIVSLAALLLSAGASAAPSMPNEFTASGDALQRIFAYFGGVSSWSTSISTHRIHTGDSCRVDIAFQPDPNFTRAGVGVGTFGTSAPNLAIAPNADTFSITIESPASGSLSFWPTIREDDNGDGLINQNNGDDQWETDPIMILPGVHVYNLPFSAFILANPGEGNEVQNFTSTPKMGYFLTFETRAEFPGGQIVTPVFFHVDHLGFYHGAQSIPAPSLPGDVNGDGLVNFTDLNIVLSNFGLTGPGLPGDADADGDVDFADLNLVLSNFGAGA